MICFAKQDAITRFLGRGSNPPDQLGEERVSDVRNYNTDQAGRLHAQATRHSRRRKSQLRDRLKDTSRKGWANEAFPVYDVRDGRRRNTRQAGDILDRGRGQNLLAVAGGGGRLTRVLLGRTFAISPLKINSTC
jgi:hypothetical protein